MSRSSGRPKPVAKMTTEELRAEVVSLRRSLAKVRTSQLSQRVSAVDRTGKRYTRTEVIEVFERLYRENPRALALLFPTMTPASISMRAQQYGIALPAAGPEYSPTETRAVQKYYPDIEKIVSLVPSRTRKSIRDHARLLGLTRDHNLRVWTPEEDAELRRTGRVSGRSQRGCMKRRAKLGIDGTHLRQVLKLSPEELRRRAEAAVGAGYPAQVRTDAVQTLIEWCLAGRCGVGAAKMAEGGRRAVTETYRLHPERGAPISMDAKLFDDGATTVGDRIASDAPHF